MTIDGPVAIVRSHLRACECPGTGNHDGDELAHRWLFRVQIDRVQPGAASCRVPDGEPDPLLTRSIEGNTKFPGPKRQRVFEIDVSVFDFDAIAPDQIGEVERKRVFDLCCVHALGAGALDAPVMKEHFAVCAVKLAAPNTLE